MPIPVTEEHDELRRTVARWMEASCPPAVPRALLDAPGEVLSPAWKDFAAQGWLGLHVPEALGGQGFGLAELSVVLEEAGRAMFPGPLLTTVAAAGLVAAHAKDNPQAAAELVPALVAGSLVGALSFGPAVLAARPGDAPGTLVVSGELPAVVGSGVTGTPVVALVPADDGKGRVTWCALDTDAPGVTVAAAGGIDPTRRCGRLVADDATVPGERRLRSVETGTVRALVTALAAAEAAGGARWCLDTASDYAKVRVQFGRPIGQFQAVKHRLAAMLVIVEQACAVAWDAAAACEGIAAGASPGPGREGALAAAIAGTIAVEGFATCAKDCIQLLGAIGFTWAHDAHLYLKRAAATRQVLGERDAFAGEVAALAVAGVRRSLTTELPAEAVALRAEIAPVVAGVAAVRGPDRRRRLVDSGLLAPHWPRPWGRDATAVEQIVIEEELAAARVARPNLGIGAWTLPTLIAHGSPEQLERWVRPSMLGEIAWCQLFSEPGAGSDLAALSTRAERAEGGWTLTGQKVWTSMAHVADLGICLARTTPEAPKHDGITYFVVDMHAPGVEVRPLQEITGDALFNEVFLDGVFVPDDCVVGAVDGGWKIARATLANERVSISSGAAFGHGVEAVMGQVVASDAKGGGLDGGTAVRLGELVAEAHSLRLLHHRATLRSLAGADPGPGASVRKLVSAEHEQRVQELGLALEGAEAATLGTGRWAQGFLATRCLTIAGGTSEVQRNVIAERILGLPRDPDHP